MYFYISTYQNELKWAWNRFMQIIFSSKQQICIRKICWIKNTFHTQDWMVVHHLIE